MISPQRQWRYRICPARTCFRWGRELRRPPVRSGSSVPARDWGVSGLIPDGRKWVMVAGEGGHVTLPSASKEEDAIIEVLRKRWSHVSAERVLSGAGLVNLYDALCTMDGFAARALTPADVTRY